MMRRESMEEKAYETPEIIYEGELEVHAGSPTGGITSEELVLDNPLDLGAGGP
jgi:hypothetical protein